MRKFCYIRLNVFKKRHELLNKGNSVEPFVYRGLRGVPRARTRERKKEKFTSALLERERERERVANYLELPNNRTTFLQENCDFPVSPIYLYCIEHIEVDDYVSQLRPISFSFKFGAKIWNVLGLCKKRLSFYFRRHSG